MFETLSQIIDIKLLWKYIMRYKKSLLFSIWPIYYPVFLKLVKFKHCCQYNSLVYEYYPKHNHAWHNYILKDGFKIWIGFLCALEIRQISANNQTPKCLISLHEANYEVKWSHKLIQIDHKVFSSLHSQKYPHILAYSLAKIWSVHTFGTRLNFSSFFFFF